MRWYQKAGLSFVFGSGALLCGSAVLAACSGRSLVMGLTVLLVGVMALFANAPFVPGLLRRRAFRGVIRMRRGAGRAVAFASEALAPVKANPVLLGRLVTPVLLLIVFVLTSDVVLEASGPWVTAVDNLCAAFKNNIGKGLAVVAVIIGGLMFAFGEGGSKSAIAGLVFGAGMVLAAPKFLTFVGLTGDC